MRFDLPVREHFSLARPDVENAVTRRSNCDGLLTEEPELTDHQDHDTEVAPTEQASPPTTELPPASHAAPELAWSSDDDTAEVERRTEAVHWSGRHSSPWSWPSLVRGYSLAQHFSVRALPNPLSHQPSQLQVQACG
jgi:hypothetical protein